MIVIKYSLFALISTLFNIGFQNLSFRLYDGFGSLYIAMFIGTITGLISKYILDKRYIFYHHTKDSVDNFKKFLIYSTMGIFTTAIFWGVEIGFNVLFQSENAKYVGACIGLSIGYIAKYFLDKKYVFKDEVNES